MKVNAESKIESHQDSQQPESRGSLNGAKCLKTVPFSPLLATCMCRHQQISSSLIFYSPSFSLALRFIDVAFDGRPIARFWFLETVARMPYFAYMTTLHLYETLGVKFFWLTSLFFVWHSFVYVSTLLLWWWWLLYWEAMGCILLQPTAQKRSSLREVLLPLCNRTEVGGQIMFFPPHCI